MPSILARVGNFLETIKVVVREFQSALRASEGFERIEDTGFRTP